MKLRRQHIRGIAQVVVAALRDTGAIAAKAALPPLVERVETLLEANMAAERALEDEAHQLLNLQVRKTGAQIDESRAFHMIKRELAKQRGFVL